ncbi:MAG: bifunctional methylenetetrahydrofolate dehydrogenase/methenyltetrahydrofolate cyclohydrolase FolD [Parachlamydiales bacterium]
MILLDGVQAAHAIRKRVAGEVAAFSRKIGLTVVLVGSDPASKLYIASKRRACAAVGITSTVLEFPAKLSEEKLLGEIDRLNADTAVDGILVQAPLPSHISSKRVFERLDPTKDVDGFHPLNVGRLLMGEEGPVSCTPLGISLLLSHYKIPVAGKRVVILGRSNIVGKPLAALLMQKNDRGNATVTVAHSASENLSQITQEADILIAAIGRPHFVGPEMVREGAVVVDVGINRVADPKREKGYRVVGDVDFDKVKGKCSALTPVPGGVGPMTVATLLHNTLKAAHLRSS